MPDFNIVHSFTERLNIFNYIENMDGGQNIPLNIAFRGIIDDNNKIENRLLFKVYYDVESINFPIVLNWVGVFVLQFDEKPDVSIDDLFGDENIQNELDSYMMMLSRNLVGNLPSFAEIMENKK
ncbi:hypothetical protein [Methanobrevibacter sp.]|uniref:hypothetical protein n=1 Tax=Methanobrevibacter sp. TaxID=66852 RepID=UPI0039759CA7